jgi:hypothetical protein
MRRTLRLITAITVMVAGSLVPATAAQAATGRTCGNSTLSDGSIVGHACIRWENPAGSGWAAYDPRLWNPPGHATQLPIYAIFKPFGWYDDFMYTGAIRDGSTWLLPANHYGWQSQPGRTVRFEVAYASGHTQCIYIVPNSTNTENGHCP